MGSQSSQNDESATESDSETTQTDDELPPSPNSGPFSEGEKVLAYHNLNIYPAKVQKADYKMKEWRYHVHYLGWNKHWDEWVGVDRLLKYNEENCQLQQALNKKHDMEKNGKPGRASHIKPKSSNVARGKKRKNDFLSKDKGTIPLEKFVNLQIPPILKKQLVDDCEFVTHLGKHVKLPRTPNVEDILNNYEDYRLKKDGLDDESVREILKGLRCYFDKALPVMLLYQSERKQYEDTVENDVSPSSVYGAEHLLRLFVKLPELLVYANIEEDTLTDLQQKLVDFLKFLQKNQSAFFLSTYHVREDTETSTNKQDD